MEKTHWTEWRRKGGKMWGYDVEYAGSTAKSHYLEVVKRPDIPAAQRDYTELNLPGTDGVSYVNEGTVSDIVIQIEFNFMNKPEYWFEQIRIARKWLLTPAGIQELCFGDDSRCFYRVKKVTIDTAERVCHEIGKFTASFYCYGYQYLYDGREKCLNPEKLWNEDETSQPLYIVSGNGRCRITVNGKAVEIKVPNKLLVDTERKIAYLEDSTVSSKSVTGYYEDLWLVPGDNTLNYTSGFTVEVIPRWRCL